MRADAHRPFDQNAAFLERVVPFAEVLAAEEAEAERALESGMGAAAFDAAEARPVPLEDAGFVREVRLEVDALGVALFPGADGLVSGHVVGVGGAERAAAVLAGVLSVVGAPVEPSANLASLPRRHGTPRVRECIRGWWRPDGPRSTSGEPETRAGAVSSGDAASAAPAIGDEDAHCAFRV